jgi:predicted enzyme related to lactoylglutathione lyase
MPKVVHFEIPATQPEMLKTFYAKVFGWTYQEMPGQDYWFTSGGPAGEEGINGAIMKRRDPAQPPTVTVNVTDLNAAISTIERSGGTVVVPPVTIAGMGTYAFFKDPDGNIVGIWQHETKAA